MAGWATALAGTVVSLALMLGAPMESFGARVPRAPESGILFYAKYGYQTDTSAIHNPNIIGAWIQIYWSDVEKQKGVYDWSNVERWIKPWVDAGKKFALRIYWVPSGYWADPVAKTPAPAYVREEGAKFAYHAESGSEIPLIWDPIYEKNAFGFLEEIARKFDNDPNCLFFDVTPGAETNPFRYAMMDSNAPGFRQEYAKIPASDGRTYSDELWLETVKRWIDQADKTFKSLPLLVTLNVASLNLNEENDYSIQIGDSLAERGFYIGQNGLGARSYSTELDASGHIDRLRRRAFAKWQPFTRFFFETGGSTVNGSEKMGTLMDVMKSAERVHASYLLPYPQDVLKGTRSHPSYDSAYEAALEYGAAILGKPGIIRSGTDTELGQAVFTYEQSDDLRKLEKLYEESQKNKGRAGQFPYYMRAETDGGIQPVSMIVPDSYDKSKPYPLVIQLHGTGPQNLAGQRSTWVSMRPNEWVDASLDVIYMQMYCRQNSAYKGIGEAEVLQALREIREQYNIDPDRIYIMGHSMGGGGTCNIALHYPDLFAAFAPIDAARMGQSLEPMPEWQRPAVAMYDVLHIGQNATNQTMRMHVAGANDLKYNEEKLYQSMVEAGCDDVERTVYEGMPHHFADQIPYYTFIPEILKFSRETNPNHVKYKTISLRYNKSFWVEIEAFEKYGEFASIDAEWVGDTLKVQTDNVARVAFDLSEAPEAEYLQIHVDGEAIPLPYADRCELEKQGGVWTFAGEPQTGSVKRHGVQGPIGDVLTGPFLVVYGNGEDLALARDETDAMRHPLIRSNVTQIDFPHKAAADVTDEEIKDRNLILFGNAKSNPLIARYADRLPIGIDEMGVKAGGKEYWGAEAAFIAPNPDNPDRYAVIWSGRLMYDGILEKAGALPQVFNLPDYVIFNESGVLDAGMFDGEWSM